MSCSLAIDAVRDRTKTVTRRHMDTWRDLKPGDQLTLIEKGMGLPKGAKQVVVAEVEIVDVRVEPLLAVTQADVIAEGFLDMTPAEFFDMWCRSHHLTFLTNSHAEAFCVRRIEWRYITTVCGRRCPLCGGTSTVTFRQQFDDGPEELFPDSPCPLCTAATTKEIV